MKIVPGAICFHWQEKIEGSGLQEVLGLAQQFKDSGLFNEQELKPIKNELKELALLLAKNLITRLTEDEPTTRLSAQESKRREKEFSEVRGQINRLGKSIAKKA